MSFEIKKLDEKKYELVESESVVRTEEELGLFKNNLKNHMQNLTAQRAQAQQAVVQTDLALKKSLEQYQKINMTLGLEPNDGLVEKSEKKKE